MQANGEHAHSTRCRRPSNRRCPRRPPRPGSRGPVSRTDRRRRIGVELELLVVDARDPDGLAAHYPRHRYPALLRELADGGLDGRLTVEPGGQVELSSRPGPNLAHTVDAVHRDLAALRRRAARCGAGLLGIGVDPLRPPRRIAGPSAIRRHGALSRRVGSRRPDHDVLDRIGAGQCRSRRQINGESTKLGPPARADPITPRPGNPVALRPGTTQRRRPSPGRHRVPARAARSAPPIGPCRC